MNDFQFIGYNYNLDLVFRNKNDDRFVGKKISEIKKSLIQGPETFFFFDTDEYILKENIWLCLVAFFSQPKEFKLSIGDFYNICTRNIPKTNKNNFLKIFSATAINIFIRYNLKIIDSGNEQLLNDLNKEFIDYNLDIAAKHVDEFTYKWSAPLQLSKLRRYFINKKIYSVKIPSAFFNPFDQSDIFCLPESFENFEVWSLMPESNLSKNNNNNEDAILFKIANDEFINNEFLENKPKQIYQGNRIKYQSILNFETNSVIPVDHYEPLQSRRKNLLLKNNDWEAFVSKLTSINKIDLFNILSVEQIDAIGMAISAFETTKGFILADETGMGKGRILAGCAKAFLNTNRNVIFITEKKSLFTDFWRDLMTLQILDIIKSPILLHPKGQIFSSDGAILFKNLTPNEFKKLFSEKNSNTKLIFTTYSQFNRDLKTSEKFDYLKNNLKDSLLILDESHNASGDSNTRKNIEKIISLAGRVLFSSATFSKTAANLTFYEAAFGFNKSEINIFTNSSVKNEKMLAHQVATGLIYDGTLIRREHIPEENIESILYNLDSEDLLNANKWRQDLSLFLESAYKLISLYSVLTNKESLWSQIGAFLSRTSKQLELLSKIPAAANLAKTLLDNNIKPVFAIESTFEAFLINIISQNIVYIEESEENDDNVEKIILAKKELKTKFSFSDMLKMTIDNIISDQEVMNIKSQEPMKLH